ncbi:peptidoglycan-binding protein [Olivibacter ginsenosidimutans]
MEARAASNPDAAKMRRSEDSIRQQVKTSYDSQIGVREASGHNDGLQVETYLRYTGLGKGNAWCAAFVCWVLGQTGVENPKTAWAASLFPNDKLIWKQGKLLATRNAQRATTKGSRATGNAQLATVFGLYFSSLKRIAHCGFIDQWGDQEVITVEGNTNDSGSREGDGVYRKRRPIKSLYAIADWIGKEEKR